MSFAEISCGKIQTGNEAPGMAHGDVDMPDVHVDSRAVDDEPGPTTAEAHSESIALLLKGTKQKARPKGVNLKVR